MNELLLRRRVSRKKAIEYDIVATFNVTTTESATTIFNIYGTDNISKLIIDGVAQPNVRSSYTFDSIGEHVVACLLKNKTSTGSRIFQACTALLYVYLSNTIKTISSNAFYACSGLKRINSNTDGEFNMPAELTSLSSQSFRGASSGLKITIPSTCGTVGNYCFMGTKFTSLIINAVNPPTCGSDILSGNTKCKIYVPSESVDTYKAAAGWSAFASRIYAITT